MKRLLVVSAASAFILTGCLSIRVGPTEHVKVGERTVKVVGTEGFDAATVTRPKPHAPNVFITDKEQIVADQEPIRPEEVQESNTVVITWALDRSSPYVFPDNTAITFIRDYPGSNPPPHACAVVTPRNKVITCAYESPASPRAWKYAIKVTNRLTGRPLTTLDPWIFQN